MERTILRITTLPIALKILLEGQMKFMSEHGFKIIMVSSDGKERDDLIRDENCQHVIVNMTRKITPFQDIESLFKLVKVIRKYKPDIVHTHTPKAGFLGMIAAMICRTKVRIHTVAGLPLMSESGMKYRLLKVIERITYASATSVWPNSTSISNFIQKVQLTSKKKLTVINNGSSNGIDLKRFNPENLDLVKLREIKDSVGYSSEFTYLLYAGRLVSDKGISELVTTFKNLQMEHPTLRLMLIGPYENDLDPLPSNVLHEIENNQSILLVNWTDRMEYYMEVADFFVFPSHREGFPNVLLQAGAMSLPIICSNIPGNNDLIENEKSGFLFERKNEKSLAASISRAINNRVVAAEYARSLKKKITEEFDRTSVQQAILEEYQRLLKV